MWVHLVIFLLAVLFIVTVVYLLLRYIDDGPPF